MTKDIVTFKDGTTDEYKELLRKTTFGQSNYSNKHFLEGDQHTPHRKLRQILMHYDGVCYTMLQCQNKREQEKINIQELQNKINELEDAINRNTTLPKGISPSREMTSYDKKTYKFKIQKLRLKVQQKELGFAQSNKLFEDAITEKKNYEEMLSTLVPQVEVLEAKGITFEEAEKEYWRRRFTVEARLDIYISRNHIPISKETFKSILKLDKETKEKVLDDLGIQVDIEKQLGLAFQNEEFLEGTDKILKLIDRG